MALEPSFRGNLIENLISEPVEDGKVCDDSAEVLVAVVVDEIGVVSAVEMEFNDVSAVGFAGGGTTTTQSGMVAATGCAA